MNVCPGPTPLYHSSAAHRCHLGVVGEVRSSRRVCDIELGSIGKRTHNPNRDLFADGRNQQVRVSVHRDRRVARFHVDGHGLGLNIASRSYSHCSEMVDARVNCGRNCLQELIRMRSGLRLGKGPSLRTPITRTDGSAETVVVTVWPSAITLPTGGRSNPQKGLLTMTQGRREKSQQDDH